MKLSIEIPPACQYMTYKMPHETIYIYNSWKTHHQRLAIPQKWVKTGNEAIPDSQRWTDSDWGSSHEK